MKGAVGISVPSTRAIRYNSTATERPTIDIEKSTTDFRFQAEIKE